MIRFKIPLENVYLICIATIRFISSLRDRTKMYTGLFFSRAAFEYLIFEFSFISQVAGTVLYHRDHRTGCYRVIPRASVINFTDI